MIRIFLIALLTIAVSSCNESPFDIDGLKPGMSVSAFKKAAVNAGYTEMDKSDGSSYIYFFGMFLNKVVELAAQQDMDKRNIIGITAYVDCNNSDNASKVYEEWATYAMEKYPDAECHIAISSPIVSFYDKKTSTELVVKRTEFFPYRVLYIISQK